MRSLKLSLLLSNPVIAHVLLAAQLAAQFTATTAPQATPQQVNRLLQQARQGIFSTSPDTVKASQQAVRFVEHTRLHHLHAQALSVHGRVLLEKGRLAEARECIEQAIELCDKHLEERALAEPHIVFGFWHARHGEFDRTHQHIEIARTQLGDRATPRQAAEIALLLAQCNLARGAHHLGIPKIYKALEVSEQHGFSDVAVQVHLTLATVAERQSSLPDHARHASSAADLIKTNRYGQLAPAAEMSLAKLAGARKESISIRRSKINKAIELAEATNNPTWLATADLWRGNAAQSLNGDMEEAKGYFLAGIEKALTADDLDCLGNLVAQASFAQQMTGEPQTAIDLIERHQEKLAMAGDTRLKVQIARVYSRTLAAVGRHKEAYDAAWEAADTLRWLAPNESTGLLLERRQDLRRQELRQATIFWVTITTLAIGASIWLLRMYALQRRANRDQVALNSQLETALSQVQELQGLLPICAQCKSIRDDEGYWHHIETYLTNNSKASLSHGICPGCSIELYSDYLPELKTNPDKDLKPDA